MQDQPQVSALVKDVAATHAKLKELLSSSREPWDKDTEFTRQKLRRLYLQMLLTFPYVTQSKKADTRMWLETSHAFISAYKEKLSQLDKIISAPAESRPPSRNRHGPVEYRKLAQRFRQFLAEEEKFWIAFVTRFVRLFSLDEAKPALHMLGIAVGDPEPEPVSSANGHVRSRSHLFPEEGDPYTVPANLRGERLLIVSKALVCIGDIARYREQWNESGGRPRAGKETHDDTPRRGGRGGRREPAPRPRNYARARDCYEQARSMFPESGNSSHQLAILASYESDTFSSLYHYYRSLCVRNPYTSALENMEKQMHRYLELHLPAYKLTRSDSEELMPRVQVDNFKESLIILHSLWRSDEIDKYDLPLFSDAVVQQLESQVTDRVLPSDLITKTSVLAIGALWTHRMYRGPNTTESKRRASLETLILGHILDVFRTLMQIGISQLADTTRTPADTALDIAQHITAVLRRMLPALRICTKWLISNLDSICGPDAPTGPELSDTAAKLWDSYIDFASLLLRVFPLDTLRSMRGPLEEDVDMTGYAPLKRLMQPAAVGTTNGLAPPQNEVHPNEEQLMRIHDLLRDAMDIGTMKDSPIAFVSGKFVLKQKDAFGEPASSPLDFIPSAVSAWRATQKAQEPVPMEETEDDARTVSTRTEDDPVHLAMHATLEDDDDDDEEQILYPKNMMTPGRSQLRAAVPSPISPLARPPMHNRTSSTTTTDLVNSFLGGRYLNEPAPQQPAAHLLFGPNPSNVRTSIWSTSLDTGSPSAMPSGMSAFSQASLPTQTQTSWASSMNPASPTRALYQQSPTVPAFPPTTLASAQNHYAPLHSQASSPYAQYSSPLRQPVPRQHSYYDSPTMADPYNPFPIPQHHPAPYPVPGPVMQSRPWS